MAGHRVARCRAIRGHDVTRLNVLVQQYLQLRGELEDEYNSGRWDSARVNHIADRLVPIELTLASLGYRHAPAGPIDAS
jgi:hypothetical protein